MLVNDGFRCRLPPAGASHGRLERLHWCQIGIAGNKDQPSWQYPEVTIFSRAGRWKKKKGWPRAAEFPLLS